MPSIKNINTFYDPKTKVWSGPAKTSTFNPYQNVAGLIFEVLKRNGDKVIQISADSGVELTGAEVRLRAIRIAQNLVRMGFGNGEETFAMAVRNGEHTAPVVFACFALGIPLSTLDPMFLRDDLSYRLATVRPKLVFCDNETLTEMIAACKMVELNPKIITFGDHLSGFDPLDRLLAPTGYEDTFIPITIPKPAEHPAILMCSSDTTGRSKAVSLSHAICIAQVASFFDCLPADRTFAFSSLYWESGLMMLLASTIWGATRIITREPFNAELAVRIVERYQVSVVCWHLSQVRAVVNFSKAKPSSFTNIRLALCAGIPVSTQLKRSFEKLIPGRSLVVAYGFTEIGTAVALSMGDAYRDGSVGFVRPGIRVKIVDDDGKAVDVGEEGEILVWAEFVFSGYYGTENATWDMLDNKGWLDTGDVGRFDDGGLLYVVDRKKDIIKYYNFKISPDEIESVIQAVPGVMGACVVGVPVDATELLAALVVREKDSSEPDAAKIIRKVEATLPNYKQLRGGVYFANKLPMTPTGKIMRRVVREMIVKLRCEKVKIKMSVHSPGAAETIDTPVKREPKVRVKFE